MSERYDLVVVGAGPGGSSTAYHASRAGLKTLLLDRQDFPRDKPCGDGLMPHAANEVAMMGLGDWLDEPHHGRFSGFSIFTKTAKIRQGVPPTLHGPHGYVIRREETDAKLLERATGAGAEFLPRTRATKLLRSPAGDVTGLAAQNGGAVEFDAPLVVVADGVGGFESQMKAHQNAVARRQYFRGVNGPDKEDIHVFITEDMNAQGAGYGWVFYLGDGRANVGAGVSTRALQKTGRNLKDYFDRFLEEPRMAEWLRNAEPEGPAKSWSLKMGMWGAKLHGQGVMTVGDAASLIHPISGEGVGYAIESGRLAAAWSHEAHGRKDFSASVLSGYARQLRRQRAREHLSGHALVNLVPNLGLLEPLFKACERDREASRALIESFTGDAPVYSLLKHPATFATALKDVVGDRLRG
ncbi:geranylgeranyl reductase family protein [Rubrobacter tropicus]|uniref:Geranylgeranyl reductase family protein n=1 Tax=Rubrobacter tropicus TaxID=2653851 RepID=A0A6G8Q8T8_9ACTN|nr:geranylgeranyl reductase family protein [Rubrobacter tropicus]QIN82859.1 geranylgeranyl reductase family protein [Rubrobacter tropicus]